MSRYIDADALIDRLDTDEYGMRLPKAVVGLTKVLIDDAPSIDIVRCRECKHWCKGDEVYGICYRCPNTRQMKADDFCSYGEREGE